MTFDKVLPTHGGAFASFFLLRRQTVLKVGFFDEALRLLEDYHYWLKFLYGGGEMAYIRAGPRQAESPFGEPYLQSGCYYPSRDKRAPEAPGDFGSSRQGGRPCQERNCSAESKVSVKQGRDQLAVGDYTGAEKAFAKAYAAVPSRKVALALMGLRWFPRLTRRAISRWDRHLAR